MLHDLFTIAVNGRRQGDWILLLPTVLFVVGNMHKYFTWLLMQLKGTILEKCITFVEGGANNAPYCLINDAKCFFLSSFVLSSQPLMQYFLTP